MFIILSFIIFWHFKNLYHITLYHIMKSCKNLIIFVLSYFNMIKSHFDFFRKVPLVIVFCTPISHYPWLDKFWLNLASCIKRSPSLLSYLCHFFNIIIILDFIIFSYFPKSHFIIFPKKIMSIIIFRSSYLIL